MNIRTIIALASTTLLTSTLLVQVCIADETQNASASKKKPANPAEELVRDGARLDAVKTIAVVPSVIQLRFDKEKGVPDQNRMLAYEASAQAIPELIGKAPAKYKFVTVEEVARALSDLQCAPTDLYNVTRSTSWDSPAETLKPTKSGDCALMEKRDDLTKSSTDMSLFRYVGKGSGGTEVGIATCKAGQFPTWNTDRLKALAEKLGVDAVLLTQVTNMNNSRGYTASAFFVGGLIFGQRQETTQVHVQATLVNAADNTVIWQARATGTKTNQTGVISPGNPKSHMSEEAAGGTEQAVDTLCYDFYEGYGKPAKK